MYDLTTVAQQEAGPEAGARPHRTAAGFAAMIERIGEAIDSETAGIRTGGDFDIKAANARKSRHLYELSRAFKGMDGTETLSQHGEAIRSLREKLARNERAILAHLGAVNGVAELLQNAIQRAEADGTYSENGFAQAGGE